MQRICPSKVQIHMYLLQTIVRTHLLSEVMYYHYQLLSSSEDIVSSFN